MFFLITLEILAKGLKAFFIDDGVEFLLKFEGLGLEFIEVHF